MSPATGFAREGRPARGGGARGRGGSTAREDGGARENGGSAARKNGGRRA